jgi:hypothetical protein
MTWGLRLLVADCVNREKAQPFHIRTLCVPIFILYDQQNFQPSHKGSPQHSSVVKTTSGSSGSTSCLQAIENKGRRAKKERKEAAIA